MKYKSLGDELWQKLETAQGQSFVSDDMRDWPDGDVLGFVRSNLRNVQKVARLFERINANYKFEGEEE